MKANNKLLKIFLVIFLCSSTLVFSQTSQTLTQDVCAGSFEPYLINPPNPSSTYNWTLSGGGVLSGTSGTSTSITWGSTPGTYTVTAIETDINGCDGDPVIVDVTVISLPAPPSPANVLVCEGGTIPDLFAAGSLPTWYDDPSLSAASQVHQGNYYATGQTAVGTYTYYVTETWNGCEGSAATITLTINSLPPLPGAVDETACEGGVIPDLTATGTSLVWYDDLALTNQVGTGTSFTSPQTTVGVYTYYVTQNDGNCESNPTTVTLTINSFNTIPNAPNVNVCSGNTVPDLIATGVGTSFTWYDDLGLTNQVGVGSPFTTGQTAVGVYTYYVTETQNGCQSPPATVILEIYAIPVTPPIWHN